jgi:hypothetical protein
MVLTRWSSCVNTTICTSCFVASTPVSGATARKTPPILPSIAAFAIIPTALGNDRVVVTIF